ncbi:hypothetical protein HDU96_004778 [Phlyctochytrium bullatum]|nr:hypothetical protein HDU96_004778 [Phlyctochytrium bullatum]
MDEFRWQAASLLLNKGTSGNSEALRLAAKYEPSLIPLLLANGADPNVLHRGNTPLHVMVRAGRNDMVQLLLDAGAHVDALDCRGCTPLFKACERGNVDVVRTLLAAGADVGFVRESKGWTLLHAATANLSEFHDAGVRIMELVVERAPFLVERRDKYGRSPLDVAEIFSRGQDAEQAREVLIRARETC